MLSVMLEVVAQELEARARAVGLIVPPIEWVTTTPEHMRLLTAAKGIPNRYHYPWVADALEREGEPASELVIFDQPMRAYVVADHPDMPRAVAHALGHCDHMARSPVFAALRARGEPLGATIGAHNRTRLLTVETRVGRGALWAWFDTLDHDPEATPSRPWQGIAADCLARERTYLRPFYDTKVVGEGWATFWERALVGGDLPAREPYRVGNLLVDCAATAGNLWEWPTLTDVAALRKYYSFDFSKQFNYPEPDFSLNISVNSFAYLLGAGRI